MKPLLILLLIAAVVLFAFLLTRGSTRKLSSKLAALCEPLGLQTVEATGVRACAGEYQGSRVIVGLGVRYAFVMPVTNTVTIFVDTEKFEGMKTTELLAVELPAGVELVGGGSIMPGSAVAIASEARWRNLWNTAFLMGFPAEHRRAKLTPTVLRDAVDKMIEAKKRIL